MRETGRIHDEIEAVAEPEQMESRLSVPGRRRSGECNSKPALGPIHELFGPLDRHSQMFHSLKLQMLKTKQLLSIDVGLGDGSNYSFYHRFVGSAFVLFVDPLGNGNSKSSKGPLLGELMHWLGVDEPPVHIKYDGGYVNGCWFAPKA